MKTLVYLTLTWPEPASSAAGARSLQLISMFLEQNWRVVLMCAADKRPHSAVLPEEVETLPLHLNDSLMDPVFRDLQPDVVLFDRFMLEEQYGWRIENQCPAALRILDTIDLHSLREIRHQALKEQRQRECKDWFCDLALRELASIHRSDLTLLISDAEFDILTRELHLPSSLLHVVPFLLNKTERTEWKNSPDFSERRDFITIGNFRHPPNADSVRYLHEEIWPGIHARCPDAQMKVYGADVTPALHQLHHPEKGFHVCGRAENALLAMKQARVCLAPLRFGAGLKGKLLDAMQSGTPSVTTSIGVEGMQGGTPWPGGVADDPEEFITVALHLYTQQDEWERAREHIGPILDSRFDREHFAGPFMDRIEPLLGQPRETGPDQLTGAMLRHHLHRSTEYMSRWIEAKNSNVSATEN